MSYALPGGSTLRPCRRKAALILRTRKRSCPHRLVRAFAASGRKRLWRRDLTRPQRLRGAARSTVLRQRRCSEGVAPAYAPAPALRSRHFVFRARRVRAAPPLAQPRQFGPRPSAWRRRSACIRFTACGLAFPRSSEQAPRATKSPSGLPKDARIAHRPRSSSPATARGSPQRAQPCATTARSCAAAGSRCSLSWPWRDGDDRGRPSQIGAAPDLRGVSAQADELRRARPRCAQVVRVAPSNWIKSLIPASSNCSPSTAPCTSISDARQSTSSARRTSMRTGVARTFQYHRPLLQHFAHSQLDAERARGPRRATAEHQVDQRLLPRLCSQTSAFAISSCNSRMHFARSSSRSDANSGDLAAG